MGMTVGDEQNGRGTVASRLLAPVNQRKLIRVFPRITKATPQDDLTFFGPPDLLFRIRKKSENRYGRRL